jgi:hypothetical protein
VVDPSSSDSVSVVDPSSSDPVSAVDQSSSADPDDTFDRTSVTTTS